MRRVQTAGQALRLAAEPSRSPYVCRSCLAATARQYHSTPAQHADNIPFFKRMQETIFGKKKSKKEQDREANKPQRTAKGRRDGKTVVMDGSIRPFKKINNIEYQQASRINPDNHPEYLPSATWDGLERIGSAEWIKKRADRGEQYTGFLSKQRRHLTNSEWQNLIHHVAVEVLTLQAAGRNVLHVCNASADNVQITAHATISSDENGVARVQYESVEHHHAILNAIPDALEGEQTSTLDSADFTTNRELVLADFKLHDPIIKLAILKRTMQLTGKRIPDLAMTNAKTITDIYNAFKQKEKPKKLHDEPKVQDLSSPDLPNVKVYSKRRTPVHKEMEIGRWKVIEDELTRRGLPVFGSRYVDAKEGKHLHHK